MQSKYILNCIVDSNANTEKKDTIKQFLLAMNETEKKNK